MYARPHNSENICEGLNFDRTKHLDGSTLKVVTHLMKNHTWIPDKDYDESLIEKMNLFDRPIVKAIKYSFNATLVYNADGPGYDIRKPPHGYLKRIQNKSSDVGLTLRTRPISYNFTLSYPAIYSNYHIATNNRGHISAFLTKDEYRPTAETLEDLRDSRYTAIYATPTLAAYIEDPVLREKMVIGWDEPDCSSRVIGNDSAACIADIAFLIIPAFENDFHISAQPIRGNVYHYVTRDENNWPLKKRFDTFMMWMEQSGIITKWYNNIIGKEIESQKRITAMSEIHQRSISLATLEFIFIFYGFGMILAIISFGFEVWIKSLSLKRKQNKRRINVKFLRKQIIRQIIRDAKISVKRGRC
ncbi:hypothetical protein PV326_000502 [Microctonus aethiopoides]|nr:hypothetical protein PV326_000502 [Microctonus aethiopoides]